MYVNILALYGKYMNLYLYIGYISYIYIYEQKVDMA